MASYLELFDLRSNSALRNLVSVAVTIRAQTILVSPTPTVNQVAWASKALSSPDEQADKLLPYVLAVNAGLSVAQIKAATDAAVQTNVNSAVDKLIEGGVI